MDGELCLLADSMLGRLAKWLRLLGYDVFYASGMTDPQIAARARAEGRIVLTRDLEMARRKGLRCLLIHSQVVEEQIEEVVTALGGPGPGARPRCSQCNAALVEVSKARARPHVPAYVFSTQRQFHHCPECDKYYWPGTHWKNIELFVERFRGRTGDDEIDSPLQQQ